MYDICLSLEWSCLKIVSILSISIWVSYIICFFKMFPLSNLLLPMNFIYLCCAQDPLYYLLIKLMQIYMICCLLLFYLFDSFISPLILSYLFVRYLLILHCIYFISKIFISSFFHFIFQFSSIMWCLIF